MEFEVTVAVVPVFRKPIAQVVPRDDDERLRLVLEVRGADHPRSPVDENQSRVGQ